MNTRILHDVVFLTHSRTVDSETGTPHSPAKGARRSRLILGFFLAGWLAYPIPAVPAETAAHPVQSVKKPTLEGLLYDLKSPDAFRRRDATKQLGDKRVVSAVPNLIELWQDPDIAVRRALVQALRLVGDRRAGGPLAKMLSDIDKVVRRSAIKAIVALYLDKENPGVTVGAANPDAGGNPLADDRNFRIIEPGVAVDPAVIPALAERLKDDEPGIRKDAARALGALRGREALPQMVKSLKSEKEKDVLVAFMRAFYMIGDSSVGPNLIIFVYHDDKTVHDEAILTLGLLRSAEAVPDLTKIYLSDVDERRRFLKIIPVSGPDDLRWNAFEALTRIAAPESKKHFIAALSHPNARYRRAAAEGLARLGDKDQLSSISRQRIRESKGSVRLAESFALFRLGRREYLEDLIHNVENNKSQGYSYLLELKSNEIPLLYQYLKSVHPRVRGKVAEVLGLIAGDDALQRLEPLTRDADATVSAGAVRAMRRIRARVQPAPPTEPEP